MRGNQRALVTGGAGFIGSHLVERLLQERWEVRVIDDFSTGKRRHLEPSASRIELIEGSVNDPDKLRAGVEGVDVVFHLAALGSVARSMERPIDTHENNATGTLNLLEAARMARVKRVVYSSSSSVYGDGPGLPRVETHRPQPLSPYAVSKLTGEMYCSVFERQFGLETVILRYFNVFGPRQDAKSIYAAVIPIFLDSARNGRRPVIYGDGHQKRDFTHVTNVVDANLLAAKTKDACGQIFNVGSGESVSLLQLLDFISEYAGVTLSPRFARARAGDVKDSLASIDKAERELGYRVKVTCFEGLAQMLDATRPAS